MSSEIGKNIKVSIFGESHSDAVGVVVSGIPAGIAISVDRIEQFMKRRAPGQNAYSTARKEKDEPRILSGLVYGAVTCGLAVTCGTPIAAIIKNTDTRSADYERQRDVPRPSHADYAAFVKYGTSHDIRGGGHFSGRLTAPLCFAGALCAQVLEDYGITIGANITSIGSVSDDCFDLVSVSETDLDRVRKSEFPVLNAQKGEEMKTLIASAKEAGDSVGGTIECCVLGVPAGVGEPIFDGLENRIAQAVFGIPAVKGIEFGSGFRCAEFFGSEHNDALYYDNGEIKTKTNNSGGITGGISNGMPIIFRVAIKPTPSISKEQDSVSLSEKTNKKLVVSGRHDPCIVPRAVPCIEATAAVVVLDMLYEFQIKEGVKGAHI